MLVRLVRPAACGALHGAQTMIALSVAGDRRRSAHPAHDLSQADADCRQRHPRAATTGSTKPSSLIIHAAGPAADQAFHISGSVQYSTITARMMAARTMTKPTHDQQHGRYGARHHGQRDHGLRAVKCATCGRPDQPHEHGSKSLGALSANHLRKPFVRSAFASCEQHGCGRAPCRGE